MKVLTTLFTLLFAFTAYADISDFNGVLLEDALQYESVDYLYEGKTNISELEFSSMKPLKSLEYCSCLNSMYESVFVDMEGDEYRAVYSNDDKCDGGSTFGYIQDNLTGETVAQIVNGTIIVK